MQDNTTEDIILLQNQIRSFKQELDDIRYLISKKTGGGPNDIKGRIVSPSSVTATLVADSVAQAELDTEIVAVTVSTGASTGTGTVTSGSIVLGYRPTGNNDQFVDNVAISGTTLTITLAANATADNTFSVVLLTV